ncbi:DUF1428 family protein [Wenzhouxiangella sp. XN79A]|nr:DUF1428 family protein [Wenzhouxiangella sp. XN79A]
MFPIPTRRIARYRSMAEAVARIWIEHGALAYHEYAGDDMSLEGTRSFIDLLSSGEDETIGFGWVVLESRAGFDAERMAYREVHWIHLSREILVPGQRGLDPGGVPLAGSENRAVFLRIARCHPSASCRFDMQRFKAILTLLTAVAFLVSPVLSSGFNGFSAGQFPIPQVDPPVQPAGYAFSIWGLIYLALLAGAVFGVVKRASHPGWDAARWPLIASLAVGAAWIPVANRSVAAATVLIWIMLATAVLALRAAGKDDRVGLRSPIALYAGWLTAASSVALGLMLAGYGWVGGTTAAVLCISLALVIAVFVQRARPDTPEYSAAVIWALVGVIVSNLDPLNGAVLGLSGVGIAVLGGVAIKTYPRAAAA